ncbi:type I-C CRISPR-associated protein Cas8c/Csd1 [Xylanibacillus composti]|uniref:Type I-C CRISPR-associated protein Cas8c/Csd1 n=1 Tax=Xylanibacillus composti TaxID=1572762 RepID=A0A8J4H3F7_9BACL|nr:type I-C CRISPR-associated protein Cas8c/Csd1 [Xylanibacillus composti]MDT9726427.1 type I-C CRISPR-associated protein Cas8c/Csd1 [Xylanibacillus composti]GIQ67878.1 type I-C CRISPR-associated protein Cas8c/Csd1 [Xylanibacillus composti]
MIFQALYNYYQILLDKEGDSIPQEGYSSAGISFEVHIGEDGNVLDILSYEENGKSIKKEHMVPEQIKRASNIFPYFLCDKAEYLFGEAISKRAACRREMQALYRNILNFVQYETVEVRALRRFVEMEPEALSHKLNSILSKEMVEALQAGGLCAIKYAPTGGFYHHSRPLLTAWERYLAEKSRDTDNEMMNCLITGEQVSAQEIARLHPSIKNVIGAQSSGAALVSFNKPAFCSYNKEQSYNAPTSKKAANAYGYVLNRLLADQRHRVRLNDTTVVFWVESSMDHEQLFLANLLQENEEEHGEEQSPDAESVRERLKNAVVRVRHGQEFADTFEDLDPSTTFYMLGLSPNAARLSIRFFYKETLGALGKRVWQHYKDLSIEGLERTPTIRQLLRELAVGHDWSKIPPNLEGQMLRSIINGLPYSKAVFAQLLNRIRSDSDDPKKGLYKIGAIRAAMLKAYLLRSPSAHSQIKKGDLTMAENKNSSNAAYHLGRLFACLEKTQGSAQGGGINATIRDRFWGAASTSPATVFPRLLSLAQHHISKDDKWGEYNNGLIQEVMCKLPEQFPRRLTLEEQGMFAIGYYHKREAFYKSNQDGRADKKTDEPINQ